jgi:hypothetical protein
VSKIEVKFGKIIFSVGPQPELERVLEAETPEAGVQRWVELSRWRGYGAQRGWPTACYRGMLADLSGRSSLRMAVGRGQTVGFALKSEH